MRVLITGINGFIGRNVALKFKTAGYLVIGIDLKCMNNTYKVYQRDLLRDDISDILITERPDIIIHCAGLASVPYSLGHVEEDFSVNSVVVYKFLETIRRNGMQASRFIFISSAAVYGQPRILPISETDELHPMSPYALHKKIAEDICLYYADHYKFHIKVLRVFSAYGPGLRKQIFWDMYQKVKKNGCLELFGTGEEGRDYIYIDDVAEAVFLVALNEENSYLLWNIANGEKILIKDIAEIFACKMHMSLAKIYFTGKIREGDPAEWCADISRIRSLNYHPKVSIDRGIERFVKWADAGELSENET